MRRARRVARRYCRQPEDLASSRDRPTDQCPVMTTANPDSSYNPRRGAERDAQAAFVRYQQDVRTALLMAGTRDRRADLAEWATRVCSVATTLLAASGATVTATTIGTLVGAMTATGAMTGTGTLAGTLAGTGSRRLIAASGFSARALDDAQGTLGEGPGIDVATDNRLILEPDLAAHGAVRWRAFTPLALARGVRGLFAYPLSVGAVRLGVLAVYRDRPGLLTPREQWIASALADAATDGLIDAGGPPTDALDPADLSGGAAAQQTLYQAHGMVMVDLQVTLTDAIARLRRYAAQHRTKPGDVARDIVAGTLRLTRN